MLRLSLGFRRLGSKAPFGCKLKLRYRSTTSSGSNISAGSLSGSDVYETDTANNEYLQFHYATDADLCPFVDPASGVDPAYSAALGKLMNFPVVCATSLAEAGGHSPNARGGRALDVGCAVGRTSFELSRYYDSVVGVDFSQHFIDTANSMKANGQLQYQRIVSGDVTETKMATVAADIGAEDRNRVIFQQGNACALDIDALGGRFDGVVAANLLCRLPEPLAFLESMQHILNPDGTLVLISPYSWLQEYTPRDKWIGWRPDSPELDSFGGVKEVLERSGFQLKNRTNLPFVMREHRRKYQLGISECTVWQRV